MTSSANRRPVRTETVTCPAWSAEPFQMREPTIREYLLTEKDATDQEKAITLLGFMVLDDKGKSVGKDAILSAGLTALGPLSKLIPAFTGDGKADDAGGAAPLDQPNGSATD